MGLEEYGFDSCVVEISVDPLFGDCPAILFALLDFISN